MGRIMGYLLDLPERHRLPGGERLPLRFAGLESRGGGSLAAAPLVLLRALLRLLAARASGTLGLVHLNVAERGSLLRKGALLASARLLGARVVVHLHAAQIIAFNARLPSPARRLIGAMFRAADLCLVLGDPWQRWLHQEFGVPATRIAVLRNGVPRPVPPPAPVGNVACTDAAVPFRVLFLGNLLARKGVAELLRALASPGLRDGAWQARLAGGGAVATYRRLAEHLGIAPRVHFTGWLDIAGTAAELAAADVLVLPSYDEGLPLVILEALSLGVPVITTPVGAIPEVLEDRVTALLVPPGDIAALAAALCALRDDPVLRSRLGAAGQALYEREFTIDRFADRLIGLYRAHGLLRPATEATASPGIGAVGEVVG